MNTKARPDKKDQGPAHATLRSSRSRIASCGARSRPGGQGGSAHTFADWTLSGHGIVLVLSTGQEFWLTLAEASF